MNEILNADLRIDFEDLGLLISDSLVNKNIESEDGMIARIFEIGPAILYLATFSNVYK